MARVGRYMRRMAWYRGVMGGSRFWFGVGILIFGARLVSRIWSKEPQLVDVERLAPGQSIQLTSMRRPTRREAKRLAQG